MIIGLIGLDLALDMYGVLLDHQIIKTQLFGLMLGLMKFQRILLAIRVMDGFGVTLIFVMETLKCHRSHLQKIKNEKIILGVTQL